MSFNQNSRRGAMLVLVAVVMVILMIGAVFSVDVAYMHMVRAELRTATDAAARAGSEALARTQDLEEAKRAAVNTALLNKVAGVPLELDPDTDIVFGTLESTGSGRFSFQPNDVPFSAVHVTGSRDRNSAGGPVSLFFAKVFSFSDFEPVQTAVGAANVRDIAMVVDVSGSMLAPTPTGTRLTDLRAAMRVFVDEIESSSPNSRISVVGYSTFPVKVLDLTDNYDQVRQVADALNGNGFTAIGNALTMGSDSLVNDAQARPFASKTIILMTDGNHNTGPSPISTVSTAVNRGQTVHTITFGNDANRTLMRDVARATAGGISLHADDSDDLSKAFRDIAKSLSVLLIE